MSVCLTTFAVRGIRAQDVSPELRELALTTLRDSLANESEWVKVHAAESLLELQYHENVAEVFEEELGLHGEEPKYRIGIWRVLARASHSETEKEEWTGKILAAFLDEGGPDRIHAAETLAKLKHAIPSEHEAAFQEAASSTSSAPLAAYSKWTLVHSDDPGSLAALADLLDSTDAGTRSIAAYALRFLPDLADEVIDRLCASARAESATSPTYVHLMSAAWKHVKEADDRDAFKRSLIESVRNGNVTNLYQVALAVGACGDSSDLALLEEWLDDSDADARIGAAGAILHIERRSARYVTSLDWAVIALYGLGMIAVGWFYMRRTRSTDDYLLGGRRMSPWAVGISLFATILSTLSYLATPGELIRHGPMCLGQIAAFPLIYWIIGWFFIPFIMRMKVISAYEILETRLGLSIRLLGSLIFLSLRLLWMAVIIYATTDKVLIPLLRLPESATPWVCAVLGLVTVLYTSMGGLRAVVFTDVAQSLILFGGAVFVLVSVTISLGGVHTWWPDGWQPNWDPLVWGFASDSDRAFGWFFLASLVWYICTYGSDQMAIQRFLATRDVKAARGVMLATLISLVLVTLFLSLVGLALLAYFRTNPHMLGDGQAIMGNADQLLPRYIVAVLPPGVSGLVVAGLLAAAMSSLSSGVNSSCSVLTEDFISRLRKTSLSETQHIRLAKWISVIVGAIVVGISFYVSVVPGNLLEICYRVVNLIVAPLFILFCLAMFVPHATVFGAWVSTLCSVTVAVLISFWEPIFGRSGPSFLYIMPVSLVVGISVGVIAGYIPIGPKPRPLLEMIEED